jgi:hypothetical protein
LAISGERVAGEWSGFCSNDFESVVFRQHPQLSAIKRKLKRLGAHPALMTCLVHPRSKYLSPVAQAFFAFVRDQRSQINALAERFAAPGPGRPSGS